MNCIDPSTATQSAWLRAVTLKALTISLMMSFGGAVHASPIGGVVTAGGASIVSDPGSTTITQSTPNAAINWQSFDVAPAQAVRFVQPSGSSVTLNRVMGPDPSSVLGSITANGKVFLVNPNGILFGSGAQVNVGGLVASTLNISDSDFMAGKYNFSGKSNAAVLNQGSINTDGGYVALLGANVGNEGVISARLGTVALAAGNATTLDVTGDGLLNVTVNQGAVNALVKNGGLIKADGGLVLMMAHTAGGLLATAVNNSGVVEAQTIQNRNGTIKLLGDAQNGTVNVSGTLDATGSEAGQTGGSVLIVGHHVGLFNQAKIDVSGDAGGGGVLIGGDYQGKNPSVRNASATYVGPEASIKADAITGGNGGKVIVWADDYTRFQGNISARGGAQRGDGGFTEVSGSNNLIFGGNVDLRAPGGSTGTLLLDPKNIIITGAGPDVAGNSTGLDLDSAVNKPDIFFADYAGLNSIITSAQVVTQLSTANVSLQATNDITVAAAIDASGNAVGKALTLQAGHDVIINAAITTSSAGGGSLILSAGNNVTVGAALTAASGSVSLIADNDGTGPGSAGGTVTFGAVTAENLKIRFNPVSYTTTSAEIAVYRPKATLTGTFDARAWTFIHNGSASALNKTYDGLTAATLTTPFSFRSGPDGVTAGQIVSLNAGAATFNSKDVGTATTVNFTGYGLGGTDMGSYALFGQPASQAATIAAKALTITWTAANNKVYNGDTLATLSNIGAVSTGVGTETLVLNGPSATDINFNTKDVTTANLVTGTGYSIADGTGTATNYALTSTSSTATANITPAPLGIVANSASKTYGDTVNFTGAEFSSSGLKNGETAGSVSLASLGATSTATVAGGPYAITASAATGGTFTPGNYTIGYVDGILGVTPAPLSILANSASKTYGDTVSFTGAEFSSSGLKNGETVGSVSLASLGATSTATVAGGPYAITASAATGGTFTPSNYIIAYVDGALTVIPAPLGGGIVIVPPGGQAAKLLVPGEMLGVIPFIAQLPTLTFAPSVLPTVTLTETLPELLTLEQTPMHPSVYVPLYPIPRRYLN